MTLSSYGFVRFVTTVAGNLKVSPFSSRRTEALFAFAHRIAMSGATRNRRNAIHRRLFPIFSALHLAEGLLTTHLNQRSWLGELVSGIRDAPLLSQRGQFGITRRSTFGPDLTTPADFITPLIRGQRGDFACSTSCSGGHQTRLGFNPSDGQAPHLALYRAASMPLWIKS